MIVEEMLAEGRKKLATIIDSAKLIEAAKLLSAGTDLVIVCNSQGILQGIVTKTDVVRQIGSCQGTACTCRVSSIMTREVIMCRGDDHLQDVSNLMKKGHLKNIPVVDPNNRPIGVLTARAVLRVLLKDAKFEEAQLVDYVMGVGYQ